jgi:ABC-type transport system involved in multi-copper enzyme maturation permease subunit
LLGFFRLVGPVFFYDLFRSSRRVRHVILRTAYAGFLFFLVVWIYLTSWNGQSFHDLLVPSDQQLSRLASTCFTTYLMVQFFVVALLTPAYVAGAIVEEKERKTLPFILATDLDDREIVLGKLAARLLHIVMFLLAGLPILSFLLMFGGIDPSLLLAGFVTTGVTVLSLGALSIWNSVVLGRVRDAMLATYGIAAAYLLLSGVLASLQTSLGWSTFPSTDTWDSPFTLGNVIDAFASGNVFIAMQTLQAALSSGGPAVVAELLRDYVLFHGLVAGVLALGAVSRLRRVALTEDAAGTQRHRLWTRLFGRPVVGAQPIIWREVFAEAGTRRRWLGRIAVAIVVFLSFLPVGFIFYYLFFDTQWTAGPGGISNPTALEETLSLSMNWWVRIVGTAVATLLLLHVAIRAAGSVSGERDRQTLDSLLTTPLEVREILYGKWLGSILGQRWAWIWLAAIYVLAALTGGVNVLALPLVLGTWLVLAAFFAVLGLWFSVVCTTTLRAIIWTVVTTAAVGGGHWFLWMCCSCPATLVVSNLGPGAYDFVPFLTIFESFALTPSGMLGLLAFRLKDFEMLENSMTGRYAGAAIVSLLIGLVIWGGVAGVIWGAVCRRFTILVRPRPRRRSRAPEPD